MTPIFFLEKLLSENLLGEVVQKLNDGVDINIEFTHDDSEPMEISFNGKRYNYMRSTTATLKGVAIGRASTYWIADTPGWDSIKNKRMLGVIKNSDSYTIERITPESDNINLSRKINAIAGNQAILINEQIFLDKLSSVV